MTVQSVDDTALAEMQVIEQQLLTLLTRVRRTSIERARRIHPELQAAGYAVLLRLVEHDATRASDLVAAMEMDKGSVSRQIAQLERLGLVKRQVDPADGRAQRIALTTAGRRGISNLRRQGRAEFQRRLSTWTAEDLCGFATHLQRYNETLDA
ncbi:MAG: MarR family winged helix-turn-helix transcriptional regulator [Nocardioidaceae bacterium]